MMFNLIKAETLPLTPELVAEFITLPASPTERPLLPRRVAFLQNAFEEDRLVNFDWVEAILGEQRYRVNGQHSATMLSRLNGDFPRGRYVHKDTYRVADEDELVSLFRQFDARQSGRSAGDVAGAYQMAQPDLRDVDRKKAKLAIDGCAWYRHHIEGFAVGRGDDVYRLFSSGNLHDYIRWIGDLLDMKTPELESNTVVGAMYATHIANEEAAKTFWGQVARGGVDYEEEAPSTVLDQWLKAAAKEKPKVIKPGELYQGCVYAWNSYRRGRSIERVRYDTSKDWLKVSE
jgi:hypothetical protein